MPTSHMYFVCVCCLFMAAAASECGAGESCAAEEDVSALFQSSVETQGSQPSDMDEDGEKEEVGVGTDLLETEEEEDAVESQSFTAYPPNTVCKEVKAEAAIRRRRGNTCMCRRRHGPAGKMGGNGNNEYSSGPTTGWSCVGPGFSDRDNFVYNYNKATFRFGFYKMGDSWLTHCPPGYIATANPSGASAGGTCEVCRGMAARRRGAESGNPSCTQCPRGWISQDGSDQCQHIQDTCNDEQCIKAKGCLEKGQTTIGPKIKDCVATSGGTCFHPGKEWCAGAQRGLFECQKHSLGCFFEFLCHSACICSEWKDVFCGGRVGNVACSEDFGLLQGNSTREVPESEAALTQNRADDDARNLVEDEAEDEAVSLDESLSGKRNQDGSPSPPCRC